MRDKQDPILVAREQALQQLECSGGAEMADAVRRADMDCEATVDAVARALEAHYA